MKFTNMTGKVIYKNEKESLQLNNILDCQNADISFVKFY